jgi:hypothetical protein
MVDSVGARGARVLSAARAHCYEQCDCIVNRCKCGSTDHLRTSHRSCPLNKKGVAPRPTQLHNTAIPDSLLGSQSAAQLEAGKHLAETLHRGEMAEWVFLDELAASGVFTNPEVRVQLVDIKLPHDRRAFQDALTATMQGIVKAKSEQDIKRAYTKYLMLGRVLVRRPLGRVRAAKLNIQSWSTTERLRLFTEGRYLKELWEDSVRLGAVGAPGREGPSTHHDEPRRGRPRALADGRGGTRPGGHPTRPEHPRAQRSA